ncbi:GAF domain-containing protein [Microcoleus sp. FACHB-1515]|uniref:sensor histidine kinase n=1 Tax=Cyanophyceae TaxID=3028117 RepID=UPI001684E00C|nr:GAF domain-containing protein [Microcoleus sp. FACHB-1515]MBD2090729.1 GAF domain-containing protein [Microcoleus sp. FACHB-1515]
MEQDRLDQQIELVQHRLNALCIDSPVLASVRETLAQLTQTIARLEDRSQHYQDLFEFAPDAYIVTNAQGQILTVNQAAARLLDRSPDDLIQQPFHHLLTDASRQQWSEMLSAFEQGALTQTQEVCLLHHPEPIYVLLSGSAQRQADRLIQLRWLLHDIRDRKLVEQQLRQRVEQGELIGQIARRIRLSLNPQEILSSAVAEVRQFLQTDRVVVYRIAANGSAAIVAESVNAAWPSVLGTAIDPDRMAQRIAFYKSRGFAAIDDAEQIALPPEVQSLVQQHQIKAAMVTPILQDDKLLGLICAHVCAAPRQWKVDEANLLQQLADQIAIAIAQSEKYQQAQQLNADLEQKVRRRTEEVERALNFESMLKRITDRVRDSLDEGQILDAAVRELTLVLELSGCNAALYDLDQGISTICYDYTNSIPTYQGRVAQMDRFPEIYSQLKDGLYFQFCSLLPNPVRGQVAMLACPIFVDPASSQGMDQAVLGDLWLINHKDYEFNDDEIRLVQQVANQCAIAIRQARLFQASQAQVKELEKLNRLKDDFLSTVSHELRTPISNVKMAIHMLKNTPDETRRQRYLQILEAESTREAELINDLLDLQRLEVAAGPVTLETLALQRWLLALIEPFKTRISHRQQRLQVNCPANLQPMTCDFGMLQRILAELLNNACKYTASDHEILLTVWQEEGFTVFQLQNQAEIPAAELPHIFKKFYRIPDADPWKQGGTGLGLALVQKFVDRLQGEIQVESAQGWTTFTVRLLTQFQERQ